MIGHSLLHYCSLQYLLTLNFLGILIFVIIYIHYFSLIDKGTNMTKTESILKCNTPYANISQGTQKKIVFVCSVGMLRSATAATIGSQLGLNTRTCGSSKLALIPLSANLIRWADWIVFMKNENYRESLLTFKETEFLDDLEDKSTHVYFV